MSRIAFISAALTARWSLIRAEAARHFRRNDENYLVFPGVFLLMFAALGFVLSGPAWIVGATLVGFVKFVAFFSWIIAAYAALRTWADNA